MQNSICNFRIFNELLVQCKAKLFLHMLCRLVGEVEVEFQSFLVLALDRGASFISYLIVSEYYTTWHLKILWK